MNADRRWLPSHWLDETVPRLEISPDSYIERDGDRWRLRVPADSPDRSNEFYNDAIEVGQIVDFCWHEDFGDHVVTVHADRRWTCPTTWPDHASHFWTGDFDTLSESVDQLVDGSGYQGEPLETGEHDVRVYFWSHSVSFRFEVEGETARFVQCAGVS